MLDFPAAHSMDTEWFAVDADGNIGVFDSGEGGAIPKSRNEIWRNLREIWDELDSIVYFSSFLTVWAKESSDRIINLNIPSESVLRSLGFNPKELDIQAIDISNLGATFISLPLFNPSAKRDDAGDRINERDWRWIDSHWLLIPSGSETDILEFLKKDCLLDKRKSIIRFSGNIPLILATLGSVKTIKSLIRKGLLRYVIHVKAESKGLATLLGFFSYEQEYQDPYPYYCDGQPIYPLKLPDLPDKLQRLLADVAFKCLKFAENMEIQPIEHMPCDTWYDDKLWVDTQGNEREGHPDYSAFES